MGPQPIVEIYLGLTGPQQVDMIALYQIFLQKVNAYIPHLKRLDKLEMLQY